MNEQQKIQFNDYVEQLEDPYFVLPYMEKWIDNMLLETKKNKKIKFSIKSLISKLK